MDFEEFDIKHTARFSAAVSARGWRSCQLSAASLYCYKEKYQTEISFSDGFIFIKQRRAIGLPDRGVQVCYFAPVPEDGAGPLENALKTLMNNHYGCESDSFVIWGVADDMLDYCGGDFERAGLEAMPPDRDWAEYIHTPENLIDMRGKRFHAKKNAVNQFLRQNSDFSYVPINGRNTGEAADFQKRLLNGVRKFARDEKGVRALEVENTAIMRGLERFEELELKGGIIRVDGETSAFAFGGGICGDTFGMMFEKGLRSYNGIFQVLEQEMLKHNVSGYRYVNREEDLGEPGLRTAKERLRPDILLYKRSFTMR